MERTNGRIDGLEEVIGETNGRIDEIQDVKGGMRALMDTTNYTRQTLVAVQSRLANLEQTNAGNNNNRIRFPFCIFMFACLPGITYRYMYNVSPTCTIIYSLLSKTLWR